ncbi:MAG: permease [Verrucomicrobiota bacterium]
MASCCHEPGPPSDSCCHPRSKKVDWLLWGSLSIVVVGFTLSFLLPASLGIVTEFCKAIREFVSLMWWGLVIGILAVGFLQHVPQERVLFWLGERSNFSGLLRAVAAGLVFDVCSHGILLIGMQLYRRGLSLGQTMAFLIASPWNSFSLTFILIGLVGLKWTALFILASVFIAFVSGWIFHRLEKSGRVPGNPYRETFEKHAQEGPGFIAQIRYQLSQPKGGVQFVASAFRESTMILRWILFGIVLAAILRVVVNPDLLTNWFGASIVGLLLTLLAATIIEVCSEGSSPIAGDLLNRAGSPGSGFTFLMAGVATDYTEILSLRETTRSWKIALLLPAITVPQILVIGWIMNAYLK